MEQTVSTRLTLDASDLKKEMEASGKAADELAGNVAGMGDKIDRVFNGMVGSAGKAEEGVRDLDARMDMLTGADRAVFIQANVSQAEAGIRQIDQMLSDPSLTDVEITLALDKRNQASRKIEELKGELAELGDEGREAAAEIERGFDGMALAGAVASAGVSDRLDNAATSAGSLRAQLGLVGDEAREFDQISKDVYANNYGETMGHAAQVTGMVHQSLGLVGDELKANTQLIFSVSDAFEHVGADTQLLTDDLRVMKATWPGLDETRSLDLIAHSFQSGTGNAGDLLDTVQEYSPVFADMGFSADDMFLILNEGMRNGARNTDFLADAFKELGIRIQTEGDTGQQAIAKLFPPEEADRLITDFTRGGEAGRAAFQTIAGALVDVKDPQDQYNLSVELFGTKAEDLSTSLIPTLTGTLGGLATATNDAAGAAASTEEQYTGFRNTLDGIIRTIETSAIGTLGEAGVGFADVASNVGIAVLGFQGLKGVLPSVNRDLGGTARTLGGMVAKAGGYLLVGQGVSVIANSLADLTGYGNDLSNLNAELEILARTGREVGDLDLDRIALAIDEIIDPSGVENAGAAVSRAIDGIGQAVTLGALDIRGSAVTMEQELQAVDDVLAGMVDSGNADLARDLFEQIADKVEASGHSADDAAAAFPGYATALELAGARSGDLQGLSSDLGLDIGGVSGAAGAAVGPIEGYGETMGDAATKADELEASIRGVIDANRAQIDPFFAAADALHSHEEAQQAVIDAEWAVVEAMVARDDAIKEHGRGSEEAEEAAWNLVRAESDLDGANRDVVRSAQDVSGATYELKRQMDEGKLSIDGAKVQLAKWVDQGLITEAQAAETARELGIVAYNAALSDGIEIMIPVGMDKSDFDAKFASLKGQLADLDSQAITTLIERDAALAGRRLVGHAGGVVPGPVGHERVITALGGEILVNPYDDGSNVSIGMDPLPAATRAVDARTAAVPAGGGGGGGGTLVVEVPVNLDGREIGSSRAVINGVKQGLDDGDRRTAGTW